MIEIDLAPPSSSSPSSPSVSKGAAEDFARALDAAEGRASQPVRPRAEQAGDRDERTDPSASATARTDADAGDTESVEADGETTAAADKTETDTETDADETAADGEEMADDAGGVQPRTDVTVEPTSVIESFARTDGPLPNPTVSMPGVETPVAEPITETPTIDPVVAADAAPETETVPAIAEAANGDLAAAIEAETAIAAPDEEAATSTGPNIGDAAITSNPLVAAAASTVTAPDAPATGSSVAVSPTAAPAGDDITPADSVAGVAPEIAEAATITANAAADGDPDIVAPPPPPAPTAAATEAVASETVAGAGAEIAPPTQVAVPPTATPVDPLAAADVAASAEIDVPTPPQQIAEALRDVRRMADGSHRLSLQLHPEELGVVQLEVAVRDGQLHLRAATELDSTRRLLAASMPELREQLADAGVSAGSLEVGAETAGGDRSSRDDEATALRSGFDETTAIDHAGVADAVPTTAPGRLDVRL